LADYFSQEGGSGCLNTMLQSIPDQYSQALDAKIRHHPVLVEVMVAVPLRLTDCENPDQPAPWKVAIPCHYQYISLAEPHNGYDLDIMTNT
jgi:hypothetical protein